MAMQIIELRNGNTVTTINTESRTALIYNVTPAKHFSNIHGGVASLWEIMDAQQLDSETIHEMLSAAGYRQDEDGKWWNQEMADNHGADVQP